MKHFLRSLLVVFTLASISTQACAQELVSVQYINTAPQLIFSFLSGQARYDVDVYKVLYTTPDVQGRTDTASGLLTIPKATGVSFPIAIVHHGTVASKDEVPSNLQAFWEFGGLASSLGYVSMMPDYLGLGESRGFHPYVHAATEASASVDMYIALQSYFEDNDIPVNGQLFLTGYSQGGHASMATHQLLETNYSEQYPVTAAAHLSGPYSISVGFKESFTNEDIYGRPSFGAWAVMSYNETNQLYDSLSQYMKEPYAGYSLEFYRGEIDLNALDQKMTDQLVTDHGAPIVTKMFQDSLIEALETDDNHPLLIALRENDTYNWGPNAPTRLYYCEADQTVGFRNSILADSIMNANGAVDLKAEDVSPASNHIQCVLPAGLAAIAFFGNYASFSAVTSTQDLPTLEGVQAYPNPAGDYIQMRGLPQNSQLQIFDLSGRILRNQNLRDASLTLAVNDLEDGMYLFRIVSKEGVWNEQILIQR